MEHKRQFLICKRKEQLKDFSLIELSTSFFLYYHRDLDVTLSHCKMNILIGSSFKSIKGSISADLNEMNSENYNNLTSDWCGRWILIVDNKLHIDSAGMLGCYYSIQNDTPVISSSLALLNELYSFKQDIDFKDIKHGNAMNWFPPPLTKFVGLRKLLVGESICLDKGTIEQVGKKENNFKHLNSGELYKELAARLATIVSNISTKYEDEVYLPLTAGFDSRTILAALLERNVSFSAFLFEHDGISNADKNIPPILSKKFNFPFLFIKRTNTLDKEKLKEYIDNSSGQAADAGILFHAHGQYEPLENQSTEKTKVILRGGVWEVGRNFYPSISNSLLKEEHIVDNLKGLFPILKESPLHEKSIRLWVQHTQVTHSCLNFRDRFYLEQRVSGWLAALEQASDLTKFDRIHPANCKDIIDLLSLSALNPQSQIIKELQSELLKTPFNPKSLKELCKNLYYIVYHKLIS